MFDYAQKISSLYVVAKYGKIYLPFFDIAASLSLLDIPVKDNLVNRSNR